MTTLFYGGLITPETLTSYRALPHALLSIQQSTGVILWIEDDVQSHTLQDTLSKHGVDLSSNVDLIELKDGEFLLPGFIDTHTVSLPCVSTITFIWCAFCSLLCSLACSAGDQYWQVWIIFM